MGTSTTRRRARRPEQVRPPARRATRGRLLLSLLLAVCMAVGTFPVRVLAATTDMCECGPAMLHRDMLGHTSVHVHAHDTGSVVNDNDLNHVSQAGTYFLAGDQALAADANKGNQMWETPVGETVIWTDGHTISIDASASQYQTTRYAAIVVKKGSTLTLSGYRNDGNTTPSKITGDPRTPRFKDNNDPRACAIFVARGGTLNIYGIDIAMTSADTSGIVVEPGGTVNVYEGARNSAGGLVPTKIEGNSRYGIENMGGTVNLYGGTISGNALGGVYAERDITQLYSGTPFEKGNAIVNMYGGTISGNPGGGVRVDDTQDASFFQGYSAALNLYGGTITGNGSNDVTGGGVYVNGDASSLTLHGEALGQDVAKGSVQPGPIRVTDNFGGTGANLYVNNTSDNDPRITVTAGESSVLRAGSSIGIATAQTVNGETDDDVITTNCPESARFLYSEVSGYVTTATADDTGVSLFKGDAQPAPVQAKSELTCEYTGKAIEASEVDDGTAVKGTWSWKDGKAPRDVADSGQQTAVFTPANTDRYQAVEKTVQVSITPKQLEYGFFSLPSGIYGGTLKPTEVRLLGSPDSGDDVPITVTYQGDKGTSYGPSTVAPQNAGSYTAVASTSNTNYRLYSANTAHFSIAPAVREAPDVTATAETVEGKGDGRIVGLTTGMEISTDGTAYNGVTTSGIGRPYEAGTYYVREKADPNYRNNPAKQVVVAAGRKLVVSVPADQEGYSLTTDDAALSWRGDTTLRYELKPGYLETGSFRVLLNGSTDITQALRTQGSYPLADVEDDVAVTVEGVADLTAPDVTLRLSNASWKQFFHAVSFGLFFKDDVEKPQASVTASDAGSGLVRSFQVLASETPLDSEQEVLDATGWHTTELGADGTASFDIGDVGKRYLYVRVADAAGNTRVVGPDGGVVVYHDAAADTDALTYVKGTTTPVTAPVRLNGNAVARVLNGDDPVPTDAYAVDAAGEAITFEASYLDGLAAGTYALTVSYDPQGEPWCPYEVDGADINDAPATTSLTLVVERAQAEVSITGDPGKVYDAAPAGAPAFSVRTDAPDVTVEYKLQDEPDSAYRLAAPTDAGAYVVRVSAPETETFTAASATRDFVITPRDVIPEGVTAGDKVYDGTTLASITSEGTLDATCPGDDLMLVAGSASFDDKAVGTHKPVRFDGFALGGSSAKNYRLAAQPESVVASITPASLSVSLHVADKTHDGTTAAAFDGTPTLLGLVEGDDVTLVPGTPSFSSPDVGDDVPVDLTEFSIEGADAANYLLEQPEGVTACIKAPAPQPGGDDPKATPGGKAPSDARGKRGELPRTGDEDPAWLAPALAGTLVLALSAASRRRMRRDAGR